MKIKELYEQTAKIKRITKLKPIKSVSSTEIKPTQKPHHISKPTKSILTQEFPKNAPTGSPELDAILHNLRNGLPSGEERKKQKQKITYKYPTS